LSEPSNGIRNIFIKKTKTAEEYSGNLSLHAGKKISGIFF